LLGRYKDAEPEAELFEENLKAILDQLIEHHHFDLSTDDRASLEYVYRAFFTGGPFLTYSGPAFNVAAFRRMPTYADLMIADDGEGQRRSYLASEENFRILQELQKKNLIIPLVGDFAGPRTIRALGEYLNNRGAVVNAIYTSNVEQYLFQQGNDWRAYYSNVAALPIHEASTFIRAVFNIGGFQYPAQPFSVRSVTLLCPVRQLLDAFVVGQIGGYMDVIRMSK
jgi:hypothetical protein